jgi:AraC-like DNA-binding protein
VGVEVPKALLALPGNRTDLLIGRRMSGRNGIGALLAQFLTRLAADTGSLQQQDGHRLGTVVLDLLSALFAHELHADSFLQPETQRRTLLLRIQAFIQHHLHDPRLTPGAIAAAHHISPSYLHRFFREEDATVAAWIRHQRLERVRRDLAGPALRPTPIYAIACRWGFPRAADFSRAFRTAYGIQPKDYRHQVLNTPSERIAKKPWTQC